MLNELSLLDSLIERDRAVHAENARIALSNAKARAARRHARAAATNPPTGRLRRLLRSFCK
jgi:hypothetical protein